MPSSLSRSLLSLFIPSSRRFLSFPLPSFFFAFSFYFIPFFLSFVFPSLSSRFLPSFFFLIEPSPLQLLTRVFGVEAEWEDAAILNVVKVEVVVVANVVVKVVMVLVRALEQIRSRAPSCLVLLFLLLPPFPSSLFFPFFKLSLFLCPIHFTVIFSPSFYLFGFVSIFFL